MRPDLLLPFVREPDDPGKYEAWLRQDEVVQFLDQNGMADDIIVYAGLPHVFIHAILIPKTDLVPKVVDQLLEWNFNASSGWCLVGSKNHLSISEPLALEHIPLIKAGEPIIFQRSFEGVRDKSSYIELNQKIAHILGLHHMHERNAWCKLSRFGDIDEILKIQSVVDRDADCGTIVTIRRSDLAEYAAAGNYVLLRMFDFSRFRSRSFEGWGDKSKSSPLENSETIFGRFTTCGKTASYLRGIQVLDLGVQQSEVHRKLLGIEDEKSSKQYATFIAMDWLHKRIDEFSCDPRQLGTYFAPSENPYEMSPAFFRPEVLSKYKADSEKYTIGYRSVTCRGAWYLKNFGVNDAGQIHVYLGYLGDLPYEEQLHWKTFNERPKAGLSQSVIKTDFDGEFCTEYDPLLALKQTLHDVHERRVGWWSMRDETLPNRVHYPLTDTRDEWASELMNLDQLLVEGLVEKWLRRKAVGLGRSADQRLRPLKLLEECLFGLGFEQDHARQIMSPWHAVHTLRSELKGHASHSGGRKQEETARKEHGTLVNHFRQLCRDCDESLEAIVSVIEAAAQSGE